MGSERENELLDQRHQEVLTAISGVHTRLDVLNGRTRIVESKVTVLEDRSPGRVATVVSSVISGITGGIAIWFSSQK